MTTSPQPSWWSDEAQPFGDAPTTQPTQAPPPPQEVRAALGAAIDEALASGTPQPVVRPSHTARLALGLAVLARERVRPATPAGPAFVTGVGLVVQAAAQAGALARRALGPPTQAAMIASAFAATLPGVDRPRRSLARSRAALRRVADEARRRGETAVAAGRADASAFIQTNVADGIAWAQAKAVPQIVDGLVPHLVANVVPRIIDGALPEIRTRVLPIVIEDLTNDPQVRDLVVEQGRGAVGEAAQQLRANTATADDRLESAFRRLVRSPTAAEEPLGPQTPLPDDRG